MSKVSSLYGGNNRTGEDCQRFLTGGYTLLAQLLDAFDILDALDRPLTVGLIPGISEEDARTAVTIERAQGVIPLETQALNESLTAGKFGDGINNLRMKRAVQYASLLNLDFTEMVMEAELLPRVHLTELKNYSEFAVGNWLHGFVATLDIPNILDWDAQGIPYVLHPEVSAWLSRQTKTPLKFLKNLNKLRSRFLPIVEAFAEYPKEWEEFVSTIPLEYREDVLEYADSVYICDIIAFHQNQIVIDDDYIQILRDRTDNFNLPCNQNPDAMAKFMKFAPPDFAYILVTYNYQITLQDVFSVINGGSAVDGAFVAELQRRKNNMDSTTEFSDDLDNESVSGSNPTNAFSDIVR